MLAPAALSCSEFFVDECTVAAAELRAIGMVLSPASATAGLGRFVLLRLKATLERVRRVMAAGRWSASCSLAGVRAS